MSRNTRFIPRHEPFSHTNWLQLRGDRISGPFSFFNPTRARFRHRDSHGSAAPGDRIVSDASTVVDDGLTNEDPEKAEHEELADDVELRWRSRDNRKGRHALVVDRAREGDQARYLTPEPSSRPREIMKGVGRLITQYPYWDVSYLVAIIFTIGSVVWVFNAFFVWLPLVRPDTEFKNEVLVGGGTTAFIGATIFEIGSILLIIEAVNENRSGCFGWALHQVIDEHLGNQRRLIRVSPDRDGCSHHHMNRRNLVGKSKGMSLFISIMYTSIVCKSTHITPIIHQESHQHVCLLSIY